MFVHSDRPHRSRNRRCCYQYCCGFIRWRRVSDGLIPLACNYDYHCYGVQIFRDR